jgi:multicomponent Na+:H+ antiporter subunit F
MSTAAPWVAALLLVTLALALARLWRGPTTADRVLAVTLTGTTGVAVLALLSRTAVGEAALDVALILALLAAIPVVVYATRVVERG